MKQTKVKLFLAAVMLAGLCTFTGCTGKQPAKTTAAEDTEKSTELTMASEEETEYAIAARNIDMDKLDESAGLAEVYESDTEIPINHTQKSELTGTEVKSVKSVIKASNIYSSPSLTSSTIGYLATGSSITVFSEVENGAWYKVESNGRVCYLAADAFIEAEENETADETASETTDASQTDKGTADTGKEETKPSESEEKTQEAASETKTEDNSEKAGTDGKTESENSSEKTESSEKPDSGSDASQTSPSDQP